MQYGSFPGGGLPPYGMAPDGGGGVGSSIRSSSAPAFDLAGAQKQFHPVRPQILMPPHAARPSCRSVMSSQILCSLFDMPETLALVLPLGRRTASATVVARF